MNSAEVTRQRAQAILDELAHHDLDDDEEVYWGGLVTTAHAAAQQLGLLHATIGLWHTQGRLDAIDSWPVKPNGPPVLWFWLPEVAAMVLDSYTDTADCLSAQEAEATYGLSHYTVLSWVKRGQLAAVQMAQGPMGRPYQCFARKDIARLVDQSRGPRRVTSSTAVSP